MGWRLPAAGAGRWRCEHGGPRTMRAAGRPVARPCAPAPAPPCAQADASGSCEAVKSALSALPQDAVLLRYLLAAPGEITTSDIELAAASGGMVLGFNVQVPDAVQVRRLRAGSGQRAARAGVGARRRGAAPLPS